MSGKGGAGVKNIKKLKSWGMSIRIQFTGKKDTNCEKLCCCGKKSCES